LMATIFFVIYCCHFKDDTLQTKSNMDDYNSLFVLHAGEKM